MGIATWEAREGEMPTRNKKNRYDACFSNNNRETCVDENYIVVIFMSIVR